MYQFISFICCRETQSLVSDRFDNFPDNFERFKEVVLPKVKCYSLNSFVCFYIFNLNLKELIFLNEKFAKRYQYFMVKVPVRRDFLAFFT